MKRGKKRRNKKLIFGVILGVIVLVILISFFSIKNTGLLVTGNSSKCISGDFYCPFECNDWKLDSDCGIPKVYDFIESRTPNDYLTFDIFDSRDTTWKTYQPLIQKVNELTIGVNDDYQKAKKIANWVKSSKPYGGYSPANQRENVSNVFNSKTGVCKDAAVLTVAMFRLANIPSRIIGVTGHEYSEGYVDDYWAGFDSTFGTGEAIPINVTSMYAYDTEFYKEQTKVITTFSNGDSYEVQNLSYHKSNVIPRDIFKDTKADIRIKFSVNQEGIEPTEQEYCVLMKPSGESIYFYNSSSVNFSILTTINNTGLYYLRCQYISYSQTKTIFFDGKGVQVETLYGSNDPINISVETIKITSHLLNWSTIYIPTSSTFLFKNKDNSYDLTYDKNKYAGDYRKVNWLIQSDNLNGNIYSFNFISSNGYSINLGTLGGIYTHEGVLTNDGYGIGVDALYNGFSKITLPEGKYKLIYFLDYNNPNTSLGYKFFEVIPNQIQTIYPDQLSKFDSITQDRFDAFKKILNHSIEGANCTPKTCEKSGKQCGTVSDGCGENLNCGSCLAGKTCSDGKCIPVVCKSSSQLCTSTTDCCSGLTCQSGKCATPCVPKTCSQLGKQCGSFDDGCGNTINCGTCATGKTCTNGQCVTSCQTTNQACSFKNYLQSNCCTSLRCAPQIQSPTSAICKSCVVSGQRPYVSPTQFTLSANLCCSSAIKWYTRQDANFCSWCNNGARFCWPWQGGVGWNAARCGTHTVNDHQACT